VTERASTRPAPPPGERRATSAAPRRRPTRALVSAALTAALSVAACSQPPVPRDRFYRVEAAAPVPLATPALDGVLEVDRFAADGLLGQRPILFSAAESPYRLEQHDYSYWVDSPPDMLRAVLIAYLRSAGLAREVVGDELRRAAGCRLSGTLKRMEQVVRPGQPSRAVIEIDVIIERVNDRATLLYRTYRAEQDATALGMDSTVAAFNAALNALLARLTGDVGADPQACPTPAR